MADLEFRGNVKNAKEKITHVSDTGGVDATYEITIDVQLDRKGFLRLARAKLRGDDILFRLDVGDFQMSLDDLWDRGPATDHDTQ